MYIGAFEYTVDFALNIVYNGFNCVYYVGHLIRMKRLANFVYDHFVVDCKCTFFAMHSMRIDVCFQYSSYTIHLNDGYFACLVKFSKIFLQFF